MKLFTEPVITHKIYLTFNLEKVVEVTCKLILELFDYVVDFMYKRTGCGIKLEIPRWTLKDSVSGLMLTEILVINGMASLFKNVPTQGTLFLINCLP